MKQQYAIIDYNKIYYNTLNQPFKIIAEEKAQITKTGTNRMVTVQFLNTGSIKYHNQLSHVLRGQIKDNFSMDLFNGHGCIGNTTARDPITGEIKKSYTLWSNIHKRCYTQTNNSYYTSGVTIDERWNCYETFENDIKYLDGYEQWSNCKDRSYHMDKDLLQQDKSPSEKVYSPYTCAFVSAIDNVTEMNLRNGCNVKNEPKIPNKVMCIHRADISIEDRNKYYKSNNK